MKPTDYTEQHDANSATGESDHLIVVSLMSGDSHTGVETHFNAILKAARERGISATLISPYSSTRWLQRAANFLANRLSRLAPEHALLWLRRVQTKRIERHLGRELVRTKGHNIVLYAQDPLSAQIALKTRPDRHCRIVAVAHFNISEAQECAEKGLTKPNHPLWNVLCQTEAEALPKVDRLIFVSEYMRDRICSRIPPMRGRDFRVLPHFTTHHQITQQNLRTNNHAVAIGSLEPRKNQQFLINVIAACRDRGNLYSLDIIGAGPDQPTLQAMVRTLKLEQQIRFLGEVPNAAAHIKNYRVFLHAAKMESFGIVLIEALASSVPIIANPVGGIPEVFSSGVEGLYWHEHDIEQAAEQLISLLDSPELYNKMSQAALERYTHHFRKDLVAPKWLDAILNR